MHVSKVSLSFALVGLLLLSMVGQLQEANALTGSTVNTVTSYTSQGTYTLEDRGGGVYNDGTYVYVGEASSTNLVFTRYSISGGTSTSVTTAVNLVSSPSNPSSTTASTSKNDIFMLQNNGGTTQSLLTGSITIVAEKVATANSELVLNGAVVNEVHLWLKKTGAPTGTARIAVMNSVGTESYLFGTLDVSTLTTSFVETTFRAAAPGAGRTLTSGDYIGIFYNGGSAGNTLDVEYNNADIYDGTTNTIQADCTGTQGAATCTDRTARELHIQLSYNYIAALANDDSTSTNWENSGYVVRAAQTDSTTTTALSSAGASATPTTVLALEKKTTSSLIAGVSVDQIKLRLSKTGSPTGTVSVVEVSATGSTSSKLNQATGSTADCVFASTTNLACAESIKASGALVGQSVNSITLSLKRTNSPTGTGSACVLDSSNACVYTFGTIDVSTLGTSYAQYTFTNYASSHAVANGNYIGIKVSGVQTGANTASVSRSTADVYDTTNSVLSTYTSSWADTTTQDLGNSAASQAFKLDLVTLPTILNTFGTMAASSLTTSELIYTFSSNTDFTLSSGATTYIGVLYYGTDSPAGTVNVARTAVDAYDGTTNSIFSAWANGAFTDTTTADLRFRLIDTPQEASDQESGAYLYLNAGSAIVTGGVRIYLTDTSKIPQIVDIASSPDAAAWTDRRADFTLTQATGYQIIELRTAPVSAQYWRVQVDTWGSSDFSVAIAEMDYIKSANLGETLLSKFNTDGTIFATSCFTGSSCGLSDTVYISRINMANLFASAGQFTDASTSKTYPGSNTRGTGAFGGATNNGVYLLEYDCTCTAQKYWLYRYSYDLSSVTTVVNSYTDATDITSSKGSTLSFIFAFNTGGSDTVYWGYYISSTKMAVYKAGTTDLGNIATFNNVIRPIAYKAGDSIYLYSPKNTNPYTDKATFAINTLTDTISSEDTTDYINYPLTDGYSVRTSSTLTLSTDPEDLYIGTATAIHGLKGSDGLGYQVRFYVESTTPLTGTLTSIGDSRFYWLKNGLYISSSSNSGTSWNFKTVSGSNIDVTYYDEDLNVALQSNAQRDTHAYTDETLYLACDGLYTVRSLKLNVGSYSDCEQFIIKDDSTNTIGRELPFAATKDVVWTSAYTNYNIHVTVVTGAATDYYAKVKYDGKDVDVNYFDSANNVQIRLLEGQCYDLQYVEVLTSEVAQTTSICADDVIFKESVIATDLGFTFWSSVWGGAHYYNGTSKILTTVAHHLDTPYNYTRVIYNATGAVLNTTSYTNVADETDTDTFNATAYISQKPLQVKLFNEDGHQFYSAWFETTGGWLGDISTAFDDWEFAGWGIMMFLPIIFAAIFTRNTAGLAGGMLVAFIGSLVFFGVLSDEILTPAIMGLITVFAILGILAYRFLYQ